MPVEATNGIPHSTRRLRGLPAYPFVGGLDPREGNSAEKCEGAQDTDVGGRPARIRESKFGQAPIELRLRGTRGLVLSKEMQWCHAVARSEEHTSELQSPM